MLAYIEAKQTQENQSTRCVTIWRVMSQGVIEWILNLCLNVFCVGWHLAVMANHSSKCALCVLLTVALAVIIKW